MKKFISVFFTLCMLFTIAGGSGTSFAEEFNPYNSGGMNIPEAIFTPTKPDVSGTHIEPTEIFKDVYFIGTTWVGCMLYKTEEGIIMWDAMNSTDDMINILEPDMETLGLDPADIKIVMISHGHGDHYGGAKYLQDTYGAKVYIAKADEELMKTDRFGNPSEHPTIDKYLRDGQKVTIKGHKGKNCKKGHKCHKKGHKTKRQRVVFDIIATPGHTEGSMSFAVPVTAFDGSQHVLANWGGTSYPRTLEGCYTYRNSVEKFATFCERKGVDVELSMHPFVDYSTLKISQIRESGQSDSMVRGIDGVQFFMSALKVAVNQRIEKFINEPDWDPRAEVYETEGYGADILFVPNIIFTPALSHFIAMPNEHVEPIEIFNNVYYIGTSKTGCLLFNTPDGIIMWDSMYAQDMTVLEADMATLGLDPADIKIIMLSHGHFDHYGGSRYLQDTYGAEVYMSVDDISTMNAPNRDGSPKDPATLPVLDGFLADGDIITFGGLTFEFAATPGHTPGSMSFVVPVTAFDGTEHKLANWGGTNYPRDLAGMLDYKNSLAYFSDFIAEREVDVEFSIHPFVDQSVQKFEKVRETGSSDAFIYGEEDVQFFFDCLDYAVSQKIAAVE